MNAELQKDIELVDSVMKDGGVWSHKRAAWQRLKKELEHCEYVPDKESLE
jgi:hypothetical protein